MTSSRVGKPTRPIHTTLPYLIATLTYIQTYRPNKTQVLLLFSARTTQILLFRMHSLRPSSCIYYTAHNRAVRPRHAILLHYSNMSCRKDQREGREGSPKQAGSSWSARYCWLATSGGNLYPPGVWFADAGSSFSAAVTLVLFRLHLYAFIEAAALRSIVLRYAGASTASRISSFFPFVSLELTLFPSIFVPLPFSLCMESTLYLPCYVFSFRVVFFYLVTTGFTFILQLKLCKNSISQSIKNTMTKGAERELILQ